MAQLSDIWFINAPLTRGDGRQIDFPTAKDQANYFHSLPGTLLIENCTYQRRDAPVRVPAFYDNMRKFNYMCYKNRDGKNIYCFITGMQYINDAMTEVSFEVDYFQTWLFQMDLRRCLVIREHTETDEPYEHTVPENLDCGAPIEIDRVNAMPFYLYGETVAEFDTNFRIMFVFTQKIEQLHQTVTEPYPNIYLGGMPAGVFYYGVDRANIHTVVNIINENGLSDALVACYIVPKNALTWTTLNTSPYVYAPSDKDIDEVEIMPPKQWSIPGVTDVKNRKTYCYPYHFYRLTTFSGKSVDLKAELFRNISLENTRIRFKTIFSGQVNPQLLVVPLYYAYTDPNVQSGRSFPYAVEYTEFPQVPTQSDVYKNYAALNASKIGLEKIENFAGIARGIVGLAGSGGETGAQDIAGGIAGMIKMQAGFTDMQRIPDKLQGTPTGSTLQLAHGAGVFISEMCAKKEFIYMVDDYFTMYGYKVNRLKKPQFDSRPYWNYIQTANADVGGAIIADDAEKLQQIFNAGLTVWHDPAEFGKYEADNRPT